MDSATVPLPPVDSDLLVATCTRDGTPVFRNDAWSRVLGDEARLWAELPPPDQERATELVQAAGEGSLATHQLFMLIEDGREDEALPLLLNFLPVHAPSPHGAPTVEAVTITGEVLREPTTWTPSQTRHHRLETLGRMTMGIAHDFNNLLSGIIGHIELLKSVTFEPPAAAALDEPMQTIERAALDGAALVRKIQQYIRQEKQQAFEPVDLPSLVEDCLALTRPYWYNEPRRQGIAIEADLQLERVPPIMGEAAELRDVLVNLILNAVQAMPHGGTLGLSTRRLPHGDVELRVSDTGTGMSDQVKARIFEPLFTTKGAQGTGMGLAVCYGLIQEHDGTIAVESTVGEGTTFILTFAPCRESLPSEAEQAELPASRPARVLVVDDERMVRAVLSKLLSLNGHEVQVAASGSEALARVDEASFDIVFTDHGMPEMSGRELAHELRTRFPALPIVLLTGDTEAGEANEDINLVLSKPFKLDKLEATIQRLV